MIGLIQLFGRVNPPPGVSRYGGLQQEGLVTFLGNILRLLIVVGGLYALFNFIIAGYQFMGSGGDPKAMAAASAKIWQSILGLLFIAGAFVLAAIFGWLIFGDFTFILRPVIFGP